MNEREETTPAPDTTPSRDVRRPFVSPEISAPLSFTGLTLISACVLPPECPTA